MEMAEKTLKPQSMSLQVSGVRSPEVLAGLAYDYFKILVGKDAANANSLKRSHLHDQISEGFDIDREWVEQAGMEAYSEYLKAGMSEGYDKFLAMLEHYAEMDVKQRHPVTLILPDDGIDLELMPSLGTA